MTFANGAFVTTAANGGSVIAAAMTNPNGVVAYENGNAGGALIGGDISVGGRLRRAGNGQAGVEYLRLISQAAAALAVKAASVTGAVGDVDCGHFITAQTLNLANTCVLPSNFGPGNGNWTNANVLRLDVRVRFFPSAVALEIGEVGLFGITVAAGDITIAIKNYSLGITAGAGDIAVDLRYRHSIQG